MPAFVMSACMDDKDSENPSKSSLPGAPAAGCRIVSKITESAEGNTYISEFIYDHHNRLIGIERKGATSVSISYETGTQEENLNTVPTPYTVTVGYQDSSDPTGRYGWTAVYTSSDNGYLASGNMIYDYEDGSNSQRIWAGSHNSEGHLTNSTWNEENKIGSYSITWTNGNMTRLHNDNGEVITDYEYGHIANHPKCNLDLNQIFSDEWIDPFTAIAGLSGKRSSHMVTKQIETYSYPFTSTFITTHDYHTDSKGFITKITKTRTQADSNSSNRFSATSVFTVQYH